jgi:hypothetical protein
VLQRLWARDPTALRDVPYHEGGDAALLGEAHEPRRALAHLADAPRRTFEVAGEGGLDGVDEHHARLQRCRGGEDGLELGLAQELHFEGSGSESVGAELHLQRRFLAGHVQRTCSGFAQPGRDLKEERRLADPRLAANEHH